MTKEEIKEYIKENLKLSWDHHGGHYYMILTIEGEKIMELDFGTGY